LQYAADFMKGSGGNWIVSVSISYSSAISAELQGQTADEMKALADVPNTIIVCSNGNRGEALNMKTILQSHYPAYKNRILSIGALSRDYQQSSDLNDGLYDTIDYYAPGIGVLVWSRTSHDYRLGAGTSFSTPLVAGMLANLWSSNPTYTKEQVLQQFSRSTDAVRLVRPVGGIPAGKPLKSVPAIDFNWQV
jgi:subtilisin family serine protease